MKSITEHLREHLYSNLGGFDRRSCIRPPLEELCETEWCLEFIELMRNRLIMGAFRYGTQEQQAHKMIHRIESLRKRLDAYEAEGNLEHLVDFAAIAMAEYMHPKHPHAHWAASDDAEHATVESNNKES